jgi:hypothetical protein
MAYLGLTDSRKSQRLALTLFSVAVFLFFLGAGNLLIGVYKTHQYKVLIQKADYEIKAPKNPLVPLVQSPLNINTYTEHLKKLEHRLDYYTLVVLGGKVFLAFCGMLLLAALVVYRYPSDEFDPLND